MTLSFLEFVKKHTLKHQAESNIEVIQLLNKLGLNININTRDSICSTIIGNVKLHPTREHLRLYT